MSDLVRRLRLEIGGLGIIFYSPWAVRHIPEGEDYLEQHFLDAAEIARHVNASSLSAFCTGSSGEYEITLTMGPPDEAEMQRASCRLELGLEVRDQTVCFRDLYDLIRWEDERPRGQALRMPDGFYRVIAYRMAADVDGVQPIHMSFIRVAEKPELNFSGAPDLVGDGSAS